MNKERYEPAYWISARHSGRVSSGSHSATKGSHMILRTSLATILLATTAYADCPSDQDVFSSCHLAERGTEVSVCYDDEIATYSYGPIGAEPELTLSERIDQLEFEPWSGVGRSIGESVTFRNAAYSYTLVGGFDRLPASEDFLDENGDPDARTAHFGWLEVARNDETLLRLECILETVAYAYGGGIYDLKIAAGQVWDDRAKRWVTEAR